MTIKSLPQALIGPAAFSIFRKGFQQDWWHTYVRLIVWVAVAQEVEPDVWQQEGCWFDPRAPPPLAKCGGVPEQDTT